MTAAEALWSQEERHQALSLSPEMHDYFAYLWQNGWFEDVIDPVLDQVMEFLVDVPLEAPGSLGDVKRELVLANPEGVGNAIFRFILDDTLEKLGTESAGPVHWVTAAHFWFKWKGDHRARMIAARDRLPEFIHG